MMMMMVVENSAILLRCFLPENAESSCLAPSSTGLSFKHILFIVRVQRFRSPNLLSQRLGLEYRLSPAAIQ